jgi:polysaccharide deacetylase family protein (PEP-CTERM system associated)
VLTVDVEDYFQVSAFEHRVARDDWDSMECRVEANTDRLLQLFADCDVHGTFFILGWVAERYPSLVQRIAAAGHELASHGFWHRLVYDLSPDEFRRDIRDSRRAIADAAGVEVTAYRAPSFSITKQSLWALDVLVEEGFTIDSSIFPIHHDRYGIPGARTDIHVLQTASGPITEIPPSVWQTPLGNVPIGGGYFRLFPLSLTRRAIHGIQSFGRPAMLYLHPWEIDPEQPRIEGVGVRSRFRHYIGLHRTEPRLRCILQSEHFSPIGQLVREAPSCGG